MQTAFPIILLYTACTGTSEPLPVSVPPPAPTDAPAGIVDVPASGPYGTHTFTVEANRNWVNTGLFLRAGESATITATGTWSVDGIEMGPAGKPRLGEERGCRVGSLVARSGLRFEDSLFCIGEEATFTASSDDIVYVGMVASTDLGETYGERLRLAGHLDVTVQSDGATVPTVGRDALETYDFESIESGWVELASAHHLITLPSDQVVRDLDTAGASLDTLDDIYKSQLTMRGMVPFSGQQIRWFPDETITAFAYMLAGNPMRCDPSLMTGAPNQRILRASEPDTDIWGFAHEMGHAFTMPNGTWVYMIVNIESWPNLFTLRALEDLDRLAAQPNAHSYCDGRDAYLASPDYVSLLRDDPFLQLCFLKEFEDSFGSGFYDAFFQGMNDEENEDIPYDGSDATTWRYVRDRFDLAAGEDTTQLFLDWAVPVD